VNEVLGHTWTEDKRDSILPFTMVLLLSDHQHVAYVPHTMDFSGPDDRCHHTRIAVRFIRNQEVN